MLADLVKAGKLPPVEQRLPDEPARPQAAARDRASTAAPGTAPIPGLADRVGPTKLMEEQLIEWDAPDPNTLKLVAEHRREVGADARRDRVHLLPAQGPQVVGRHRGDHRRRQVLVGRCHGQQGHHAGRRRTSLRQRVGGECKPATLTIVDKYTWKVKYAAPEPAAADLDRQEWRRRGRPAGASSCRQPT